MNFFKKFMLSLGHRDEKPIKPSNGKPKRISVDHRRALNEMLKTIFDTKMDEELKMILRMRVWGKHPKVFHPMSHEQVAKDIGAKVEQVKNWEQEALYYVKQHLERVSMFDITGRFNENEFKKFKMFQKGRIIVP